MSQEAKTHRLLSRIQELAGSDVATAIQAEFGGEHVFLPPAQCCMPAVAIRFTLNAQVDITHSATCVINALAHLTDMKNTVVQVEGNAFGDDYRLVLESHLRNLNRLASKSTCGWRIDSTIVKGAQA